jgi:peptidyl-prolyl cis-trans isomerase-like protein 2
MEAIPPNPATDKPTKLIRILDVAIFKDPYEEFKQKLEKRLARERDDSDVAGAKARAREEREKDRTT